MKNAIISFIIFFIMIISIVFSIDYLNKICTQLEKTSDNIELAINSNDWNETEYLINSLLDDWENQSDILPIIVNHSELDVLNNEIFKLTQYIKCCNKDEALASIHVIKFYLNNIKKLQEINIQNIF